MEIVALIISITALFFSFIQFVFDSTYRKKTETIAAFNRLQDEVFVNLMTMPFPLPPIDENTRLIEYKPGYMIL